MMINIRVIIFLPFAGIYQDKAQKLMTHGLPECYSPNNNTKTITLEPDLSLKTDKKKHSKHRCC